MLKSVKGTLTVYYCDWLCDCRLTVSSLPFLVDTDVALGIAVKTFLDDIHPDETAEQKAAKKAEFPGRFVPYATHFFEDLDIACEFFNALHAGVQTLTSEMPGADRSAWDKAARYLKLRR
jgi:hypothetical protein